MKIPITSIEQFLSDVGGAAGLIMGMRYQFKFFTMKVRLFFVCSIATVMGTCDCLFMYILSHMKGWKPCKKNGIPIEMRTCKQKIYLYLWDHRN